MSGNPCILVTGANGFVGRYLIRALGGLHPSWRLIQVGPPGASDCDFGVDVADGDAVEAMVKEAQPTAIVHLAAVAAVGNATRHPREAWSVNVDGTLNVVVALERHAPEARLLYVSSAEVYGEVFLSSDSVDEGQPMKPLNTYAASKAASEVLVGQAARSGLRTVIARPFNHTGPGQSLDFVMPAFAEQVAAIEAGKRPPVMRVGNLDEERDFSDVRDIVLGYVRILERGDNIANGAVFNLASGRPVRIRDALDRLLSMSKVLISVETDPARYRVSRIARVLANVDKARRELDWAAGIPFEETLKGLLDHYRGEHARV